LTANSASFRMAILTETIVAVEKLNSGGQDRTNERWRWRKQREQGDRDRDRYMGKEEDVGMGRGVALGVTGSGAVSVCGPLGFESPCAGWCAWSCACARACACAIFLPPCT
jgi:hypothetical protein